MTQVEARSRARHLSFQTDRNVRVFKNTADAYEVMITERVRPYQVLISTYRGGTCSDEVSCTARLLGTILTERYCLSDVVHLYARSRLGASRTTDWRMVHDAIAARWSKVDLLRVRIEAANLLRVGRVA